MFLPQYRIEHCNGCGACLAAGRCPITDDFEAVKAILREADGIILSSPTYGGAPCARIKALFDRLGQLAFLSSFVGGKYVAAIATAGGFGAASTARQLGGDQRGFGAAAGTALGDARPSCCTAGTCPGCRRRSREREGSAAASPGTSRRRRRYPLQSLGARAFYRLLLAPAISKYVQAQREGALKGVYTELVRKGLLRPAA